MTAAAVTTRNTVKFSALDAARRAAEVAPMAMSPSRERTLHAAGALWCRHLTLPSIRQVATEVGRSAVTVLKPFDTVLDVYAHMIRLEWQLLRDNWFDAAPAEAMQFLRLHGMELGSRDPSLLRLPSMVYAAVSGARPAECSDADASRVLALYALAAGATLDLQTCA